MSNRDFLAQLVAMNVRTNTTLEVLRSFSISPHLSDVVASVFFGVDEAVAAGPFIWLIGDGVAAAVKTVDALVEFFPAANVLLRLVGVATAATVIPVEQIPGTRNDKLLTVWIVHGCGVVVSSEADCTMYSVHYVCRYCICTVYYDTDSHRRTGSEIQGPAPWNSKSDRQIKSDGINIDILPF